MPLKRIARVTGFRDEQALRRAFVQQLSLTPKQYRERFGVVKAARFGVVEAAIA
jgi:transcriptional regulator GlxA family with amidase domain